MSLQVNFSTHGHELKAAYEAILQPADPKKDDNWAIFGYDKGTNDLKVLGQGNGGLEELQEEFMDGKIQYAFVRIVDPYSQLNKFVFIAWCGDGVPESKKGLFNTHLADVANFLKGYHLQINARCEADVTPQQIMKRAEEGSGSKYSTHQEDYKPERIQPLQSAYKRTVIPDIAAMQRNPTKPESAPQYNIGGTKPLVSPVKPLVSPKPLVNPAAPSSDFPSTPSKLVGRVWPPPATAQSSSSSPSSNVDSSPSSSTAAKSWKSVGGGSSYSAASSGTSFIKVQPPSSLTSYGRTSPEPPVVNKAHQLRLEREAREKEERERIKRETAASEARERHVESSSTARGVAEERRLQEQKERERELQQQKNRQPEDIPRAPGFNRVRQERELREKEERKRAEAEETSRSAREVAKVREQSAIREQAAAREEDELKRQHELKQRHEREAKEVGERKAQDEARQRQQEELRQEEEARKRKQAEDEERRLGQQRQEEERRLRQQQQEEEEEEEERRRHYEQEQEERRLQEEAEERERMLEQEVNAASAHALHASEGHSEAAPNGSVSAIVLYSYEKAEENEMSLVEGEIIRNVTELDVGWWSGDSEDGTRSGLFPANYVEVIESTTAASGSHEHEQHYQEHEDALANSHHDNTHEQSTGAHGSANQKPSAVALYDYQAGEPNEISFAEGETIADIDFVTEDWWSGKNESGGVGLFPANYVELVTR